MIEVGATGNKNFTASWAEASTEDPGFMQVAILDTSGSMKDNDYRKSTIGLSAALYEFTNYEVSFAKTRVFYGTYITNVKEDDKYIKDFDISKASFASALGLVNDSIWPGINGIPKTESSEAMITCLYFAIDKTMTKIEADIAERGIGNTGLNAVNFILLTDEPMFKFDIRNFDSKKV